MLKVNFAKEEYENIIEKCMFNDELSKILEYRIKNYSITKISLLMNMSERTVSRRIEEIKKKIIKVIK